MNWPNWTKHRTWRALLLTLPGFVLLLLLRGTGLMEPSTLTIYDTFNRWMAAPGASERTVVIGFSESDFKYAGTYPYSDAMLADLLERVLSAGPRVIYLNVLRDIPVEPGHTRLLELYQRAPMLYAFDTAAPGENAEAAAPPVIKEAGRYGFAKSLTDRDGVTRAALLADTSLTPIHEHAILKAARHGLAAQAVTLELTSDGSLKLGNRSIPAFARQHEEWSATWAVHMIPYRYRANPPQVSFEDVLSGKVDMALFRDRTVVIGTTAASMARLSKTPLLEPGSGGVASPVWIAHNLDNLYAVALDDWPVERMLPPVAELVGLFLLAWLCCWSFLDVASFLGGLLRTALWGALLIGGAYVAFRFGWWLPIVSALATLLLAVGLVLNNLLRAEAAQRRLISFLERVLDQIPDPIYVLDERGRFRLVNQAFSQLALKRPDDLLQQPSDNLLGPLESDDSSHGERELSAPGARQRLILRESSMQDGGRELKIGIVQAVHAIRSTDPAQSAVGAAEAEQRFVSAAYWAEQQKTPLALLLIEPADPGLLESAFGVSALPQILEAMRERLERAFPDALAHLQPAPGQHALLIARRIETTAQAQAVVGQAFSWSLQTPAGAVELDISLGCAWYGPDGSELSALIEVASTRRAELRVTSEEAST